LAAWLSHGFGGKVGEGAKRIVQAWPVSYASASYLSEGRVAGYYLENGRLGYVAAV